MSERTRKTASKKPAAAKEGKAVLAAHGRAVSVVGLGYVGLPVAVAFGGQGLTIAFDVNVNRVAELAGGFDRNGEVTAGELAAADLLYTSFGDDLRHADFHIVAVPTPVDQANRPDMSLVLKASETVGKVLKAGDIVVYESTVYPGATEEECVPVLEKASGLRYGIDFAVGYSPERINPGDKEHGFSRIKKVVSGSDQKTLDVVAAVYESVVSAGVHRAPSIKVAEAAKVIENTQRDLNVALMNELALIFDRMDIDTKDVLEAAGTKWNFLRFTPGLVGGHCIGVDPYYLTHKAEAVGYIPQVILAGRRINDSMGRYIAQRAVKEMARAGQAIKGQSVTVLGLTFKENCPDIRNTKVVDIIRELADYGLAVQVHDPMADPAEAKAHYGLELTAWSDLKPAAAVVAAVAHREYKALSMEDLKKLMNHNAVLVDVKAMFDPAAARAAGVRFWRL